MRHQLRDFICDFRAMLSLSSPVPPWSGPHPSPSSLVVLSLVAFVVVRGAPFWPARLRLTVICDFTLSRPLPLCLVPWCGTHPSQPLRSPFAVRFLWPPEPPVAPLWPAGLQLTLIPASVVQNTTIPYRYRESPKLGDSD